MIDLAPTSKRGLELRGPLILSAGYGSELGLALVSRAHALVTPPTSLRPCGPALGATRISPFPGGFLYDRDGANPGLAAVLRAQRHVWRRLNLPLILSLACEDRRHWGEMARRVSLLEAIVGLELEIDEASDVEEGVGMVREESDLPIIVKVSMERAAEQANAALRAGANALSVRLAPRGLSIIDGKAWEGRLGGPPVKPLAMRALLLLAKKLPEIPLIGAGGVESADDVQDFLSAGARAVQIDAAVWRDPEAFLGIASSAFDIRGQGAIYKSDLS